MTTEYEKKKFASKSGEFVRQVSSFRNFIEANPDAQFPAEKDRYHLYVSHACPWAHRTMIVRGLKGLEDIITVSVVDYYMDKKGWKFSTPEETPGSIPDPIYDAKRISEIYLKANPEYKDRYTVPVLFDKKQKTIVNNESSEIIRMLNTAFDGLLPKEKQGLNYYPENLQKEIDQINEIVYDKVNNGVYKSGFATTQETYEKNVVRVFEGLDYVENILSKQKYLVQNQLTEADIRLFTTVLRFDPVYHGHFKCNLKCIKYDYPNILNWARRIYQLKGVAETVNMEHIKRHYYMSHVDYNPTQVVPLYNGPDLSSPKIEA
ncbi:hypothetical protein K502DRAFT_330423 [Neoconidiobolus thromboides FSU 785]|nr:hypothetical protein K502DRAFT_330423 [Neoconidiobolus thromboides FSU 785]